MSTPLILLIGCGVCWLWLRRKWRQWRRLRRSPRYATCNVWRLLTAYDELAMNEHELLVECIEREGFSHLFVGYADGACQTFYTLDELSKWFQSKGVPEDSEFMQQLQHLDQS